jgi:putative membrane protein
MNSSLLQLFVRWLIMALGVTLATKLVSGITYDSGATLFWVVVLLSFFNAVLRPLLVLFTLPFILATLGLGVFLINALLFYWVGHLVDGFHVVDFWAAMWGSLVVSLTNMVMSGFMRGPRKPPRPPAPPQRDDVIDI